MNLCVCDVRLSACLTGDCAVHTDDFVFFHKTEPGISFIIRPLIQTIYAFAGAGVTPLYMLSVPLHLTTKLCVAVAENDPNNTTGTYGKQARNTSWSSGGGNDDDGIKQFSIST